MKRILKYWELHDFCYTHGRVIPHTAYNSIDFRSFHCADRRHDDSETIVFSEMMPTCQATMGGILSMSGYVVEFAEDNKYLFCTESELEQLKKESEVAEAEYKQKLKEQEEARRASMPENPARPDGVAITRENMRIEYKIYHQCPIYKTQISRAKALGHLDPPFIMGDYSFKQLLCKDDCLFCHCPFYDMRLFMELRHNHRSDYDEWVMDHFKNFNR